MGTLLSGFLEGRIWGFGGNIRILWINSLTECIRLFQANALWCVCSCIHLKPSFYRQDLVDPLSLIQHVYFSLHQEIADGYVGWGLSFKSIILWGICYSLTFFQLLWHNFFFATSMTFLQLVSFFPMTNCKLYSNRMVTMAWVNI